MKIVKRIIVICSLLVLSGCISKEFLSKNYYILEYYKHTENEKLIQKEPFPFSVLVRDAKIAKTYSRKQIVVRHFSPRITYSEYDFWGVDLSEIIPNLISMRLNKYGIFQQTHRELMTEFHDYEIKTKINNIELYQSEFIREAHLNIKFTFSQREGDSEILSHAISREEILLDENLDTFVQKINELILNETDQFIQKISQYLKTGTIAKKIISAETVDSSYSEIEVDEIGSQGMGLLVLPAITKSDNEPYYRVYNKNDVEVGSAKMGTTIPFPAGDYNIEYGSGNLNQMMKKQNITILPRFKKIIKPDWSCLIVKIIDERRNFAKVRYEIFEAESGESYGTEFPVDIESGELERIWVLNPGLYKITLNSEAFNTYTDFTTVHLLSGKSQKLTIVVGTDEDGNPTNLIGAGVLGESDLELSLAKWRTSSAIHGNVNINSDNEKNKDETETSITLNTQFDTKVIYDNFPFYYTMKNLTEVGTTKSSDIEFRVSSDDFDLKNTFIFYLLQKFGLYFRTDINTHFFKKYEYDTTPFNFIKENKKEVEIERNVNVDEIQIESNIFPLIVKEGIGLNYRVLNSPKANLNLRSGFGMRQDFNNDVFSFSETIIDTVDSLNYKVYLEENSKYTEGNEVSIIGNFHLPFNLSYNTNADILFPFDAGESIAVEWENSFNLKLFKYISLDYKLKLENKQPEDGTEYIVFKHSLFLRITYFFK